MTSTPIPSAPSESFVRTWIDALTKPREETYAAIGASLKAKAMTGYLWILLTSIVTSAVTFLAQSTQITQQLEGSGMSLDEVGSIPGGIVVALLCSAPFVAVFAALFFAIWTALIQWVAKMFGGVGTFSQLAYTMAAISVPFSLLSSVLTPFNSFPYVVICTGFISLALGIYAIVLQITAVKGVNHLGWGQAIGSYFLPTLVLFCCAVVPIGVIAMMRLLGPQIGNTFKSAT